MPNRHHRAIKHIREQEITQASQAGAQERLERQALARQRKLARQNEREGAQASSELILPAVETPPSLLARFWGFLRSIERECPGNSAERGGKRETLH